MVKEKLCSIIIPNYNSNKMLEKTFLSLLQQSKELFELIIVDSCSTDESMKIIKKYQHIIDKCIIEKDNGIYDAMNKGINQATGQYLYFLGAGDELTPAILQTIVNRLPQKGYNFVYGNVYFGQDKKKIYDGRFNKLKLSRKNICHQSIFYSRNIFELIGLYDIRYKISSDFTFNISCFGNEKIKKIYINEIIATYDTNGISSNVPDKEFVKEQFKLIRENLGLKIWIIRVFKRKLGNLLRKII